jgi:hypothetical protein
LDFQSCEFWLDYPSTLARGLAAVLRGDGQKRAAPPALNRP